MRFSWYKHFIFACLLISPAIKLIAADCNQQSLKASVYLKFENFVGKDSLKLDDFVYKNELGQSYSISKFKYYISNINLKTDDGKVFTYDGSFLIDEEEPGTKQMELKNVPEWNYTSIHFILGVDSLHNCSGIQSGDLDPVKGMFWAWNTGYIFLKLEGKSPQSKMPVNIFEYHIGGFIQPNNCIRNFTLPLNRRDNNENPHSISIKCDVAEILKTPSIIDFSSLPVVTDRNHAVEFANNYADMFSILTINYK